MRGTGSTRTATRWRFSETAVALLALASACARPEFKATPGQPRLDTDEARQALAREIRPHCARLGPGGATGEARLSLYVGTDGGVQIARVVTSTGDRQLDEIIGAVAARLQLPARAEAMPNGGARLGYSCSGDTVIATIDLS